MGFNVDNIEVSLKELIKSGENLFWALAYESADKEKKTIIESRIASKGLVASQLPNFTNNYEVWYSEALMYIKKLIPERIFDFTSLYKNDKRKDISYATYTISDAIIGLQVTQGTTTKTSPEDALPRLKQQVSILKSALSLLRSVIYTLSFTIRADLFDSELDAASELFKSGFFRAVGAMCGVILEKHLGQVCLQHDISIKKKSPTISDYNEELKNSSIIDLPTWRYLQLLGDLRNICCHDKNVEPTKDQTSDLLSGTMKITKTVF